MLVAASSPPDIYICDAEDPIVNGVYHYESEFVYGDAMVFAKEDSEDSDVRIFRHALVWSIADFSSWPPNTLYRCDVARAACEESGELQMPLEGYSPAFRSKDTAKFLNFSLKPC